MFIRDGTKFFQSPVSFLDASTLFHTHFTHIWMLDEHCAAEMDIMIIMMLLLLTHCMRLVGETVIFMEAELTKLDPVTTHLHVCRMIRYPFL